MPTEAATLHTHRDTRPEAPSPSSSNRTGSLRVAIAGAGRMGLAHAEAIDRNGVAAQVIAVVDPRKESRDGFLSAWPSLEGFSSLTELFENHHVDVLHVCTPQETHAAVAREALRRGCHVYVEKPFAPTVAEATELWEIAEKNGVTVCAGHQLLHTSAVGRLLESIPHVGTPVHMESYFSFNPVRTRSDGTTPLRADLQLLDILPHPVYLLLRSMRTAVPDAPLQLRSMRVARGGTVHALVQAGPLTATLIVSLSARPVENHLKVVGDRGTVQADLVRDTVQSLLGPGTSGISKALNPFRLAGQLVVETTRALVGRVAGRNLSYPGLRDLIGAFHLSVQNAGPPPISKDELLATVQLCETVANELEATIPPSDAPARTNAPRIVVTGGSGFLGDRVVEQLHRDGYSPVSFSRRLPPPWDRRPQVEYHSCDVADGVPAELLQGAEVVVHCAAATSGDFAVHRRDSVQATETLLRSMADAGVSKLIHISSVAVLESDPVRGGVTDDSPLVDDAEPLGPYVWGKTESERTVHWLARELGIELLILRPGPIIDPGRFSPPGRLGRLVGDSLFVMIGSRSEPIGAVSVTELARMISAAVEDFEGLPDAVNVVADPPPTRGELVQLLKSQNPSLRVVRIPRPLFTPLAVLASAIPRKMLRGASVPDLRKAFSSERHEFIRPERLRAAALPSPTEG